MHTKEKRARRKSKYSIMLSSKNPSVINVSEKNVKAIFGESKGQKIPVQPLG